MLRPSTARTSTCPIEHCCVCSPLLFASEILCDSPAYNKQRMNKKSLAVLPGNPKCTMTCIWRLYYLFIACCWAIADTKPIERFMTKAKSQLACDPRVIRALCARQNYTLAPRELLFNLLFPYFIVCSRDHSSICNGRSRQLKNAYRYICLPFPCYCLTSVCISTSV